MKHYISSLISLLSLLMLCTYPATAQINRSDSKFSIKANANVSLGNAYSASSDINGVDIDKSGSTEFGLDFRYRFWKQANFSLGLNAGVGYATGSQTIIADELNFTYTAGPEADIDGESYQRYTELSRISQKISLGELVVPVYLDFNWQFSKRVSLYANAGLSFRISTSASVKETNGDSYVYGIYPKYHNLKIDDEWMNDFGHGLLSDVITDNPKQNSFTMSVKGGAGLRLWIAGPLSLECGVNYNYGFMNRLEGDKISTGNITEDMAPMTYNVSEGRKIKSLSGAFGINRLSALSLNIGVIVNF